MNPKGLAGTLCQALWFAERPSYWPEPSLNVAIAGSGMWRGDGRPTGLKPPRPGRLGILADALDPARSFALAYVYPVRITGEVVKVNGLR